MSDGAFAGPRTPVNTWVSRLHTFFGNPKTKHESDRRAGPRYKLEIPVTIVSRERSLRGRTSDLGQDGMGVYLSQDLNIGEEVVLQYELGDGSPPKKVRGVVRDHNGNRYAIEFDS